MWAQHIRNNLLYTCVMSCPLFRNFITHLTAIILLVIIIILLSYTCALTDMVSATTIGLDTDKILVYQQFITKDFHHPKFCNDRFVTR